MHRDRVGRDRRIRDARASGASSHGVVPAALDRAVWIDPHASDYIEDDLTPRQKMLGDVIQMLPGRDRAELEQILGPSLQTPYFKDTGRSLIYCLGPERGYMGIDSEWLLIWLDERDRFQRFAIACD